MNLISRGLKGNCLALAVIMSLGLLSAANSYSRDLELRLLGENYKVVLPEHLKESTSQLELAETQDDGERDLLNRYMRSWWAAQESTLQQELTQRETLFLSAQSYEPDDLLPLVRYVRLLMPELDIGAPVSIADISLNDVQRQALFNIAYEWRAKALNISSQDYLENHDFSPELLIRRTMQRVFDGNFNCLFDLEAGNKKIEVVLAPGWKNCIDESNPQLLWVNQLSVEQEDGGDNSRLAGSDLTQFVTERKNVITQFDRQGLEGFDVFDITILAAQINKAFLESSAGQDYKQKHDSLITAQLEILRQQHAMSFSPLRSITEKLQQYIRSNGYILAAAYIPQQDFRAADGKLELAVANGTLADVHFRNLDVTNYRKSTLLPAFQSYLNQPVSADIASAYFRINDIPGLSVQAGFFEPGEQNGETRLNVGLEEEKWQLRLRSDNYGSAATGEYRVLAALDWYNALGFGDSVNVGVLQASSPSNTSYGFAKYRFPIMDLKADIALAYEQTQYEALGGQGANKALSQGDLSTASVALDYRWLRSKDFNLTMSLAALQKSSDTTVTLQLGDKSVVDGLETEVDAVQFSLQFDYLLSSLRALTDWRLSYLSGDLEDRKDTVVSRSYDKVSLNGDTLFLLPMEVSGQPLRLNTKIQAIYSTDLLPTFERQAIGGPYGVKSFKTADFTGDKTLYANVQLLASVNSLLPGGFSDEHDVSLALCVEAARADLNAIGGQIDSWAKFQALGVSIYYQWDERLNAELNFTFSGSKEVSSDFADLVSEPEESIYFSLGYRF